MKRETLKPPKQLLEEISEIVNAELTRKVNRLEKLLESKRKEFIEAQKAATALNRKIEKIHLDEQYQAVWNHYNLSVRKYNGPTYIEEMRNLMKVFGRHYSL